MGQGDGEDATPVMSPPWTRGRWATRDAAADADGNIEVDNNRLTVSDISDGAESPFDVDNNRTFLDTETLCSRSGSSSHHLHPRPLHHYQRRPVQADSRIHAQHAYAYAPTFANRHSRDRSEPQLRRHYLAELDLSDTLTTTSDGDRDFVDKSFLISRPTSIATMAMTTSTTDASPISSALNHPWQVELCLPTGALPDDDQRPNLQQYHDLLSEIDSEFLFPDSVLSTVDNRPSSSRSHLLQWRRNRSSGSESSKDIRVSSDGECPMADSRPSTIMTREEFEALPPTIQRKLSLILSLFSLARLLSLLGLHSFRHHLNHRMGRRRHAGGLLILDASLDGLSRPYPFPSHLPINPESKAENHRNHGLG